MHSSKEINVFPFFLFGFFYEVYLHFLPLPAKHFQQEHSPCRDSNICETAYPVSVQNLKLDMSVKKAFINAKNVKIALTRKSASKETTVKHQ